jgi:DNA end-binding protein Ku
MAEQLIQSLSAPFEPEKYHDTYREAVLAMIERKAEGQEIVEQPEAEAAPKTVDLMAALEASLAEAKRRKQETDSARKVKAAKS